MQPSPVNQQRCRAEVLTRCSWKRKCIQTRNLWEPWPKMRHHWPRKDACLGTLSFPKFLILNTWPKSMRCVSTDSGFGALSWTIRSVSTDTPHCQRGGLGKQHYSIGEQNGPASQGQKQGLQHHTVFKVLNKEAACPASSSLGTPKSSFCSSSVLEGTSLRGQWTSPRVKS